MQKVDFKNCSRFEPNGEKMTCCHIVRVHILDDTNFESLVSDLAQTLKELDSIILKHSRVSKLGDTTFFSARNAQYAK